MIEVESLTDEAKNKIVAKALAQRDGARRRSKKVASDKRRAGMARVMVWVPKALTRQLHQEAARLRSQVICPSEEKSEGLDQPHDEHQPSLFEPSPIAWKPYGQAD